MRKLPLLSPFSLLFFCFLTIAPAAFGFNIVFLGDSITEGYGVEKEQGYVHLIEKMFQQKISTEIKTTNTGQAGATTKTGQNRLAWIEKSKPDFIFLALGSNDALRGLKVESSEENLRQIIIWAKKKKIPIAMAGAMAPPNYGKEYATSFQAIFPRIAKSTGTPLFEFILKDVAGHPELNQEDGIHPNPKGHAIIAKNVFEFLSPQIKGLIKGLNKK